MEQVHGHNGNNGASGHLQAEIQLDGAAAPRNKSEAKRSAIRTENSTPLLLDAASDSSVVRLRAILKVEAEKSPDNKVVLAAIYSVLKSDSEFRESLRDAGERQLINRNLHELRYQRKLIVKSCNPNPCSYDFAVIAEDARGLEKSLLDLWTMPNGKNLGDTTGDELHEFAVREMSSSNEHRLNSRFYEALARLTPPKKTVREAVGDKVDRIWKRLKKEQSLGGRP